MTTPAALFQLVRADFLERVRRHSFLVTLGFTLYAAYMFLPPNHAHYATLDLGGHRGVYNSAWVGTLVAIMAVSFLSLAGFYLVKNAVERDRQTGVGAILAATPLSAPVYLLGKMLSNFAVLATMVAVLAAAAIVMQILLGEDTHVRLVPLLTPFMLVTLPVMGVIAAVAVFFEVIPWLRGGAGNIAYFFLWVTTISLSAATGSGHPGEPLGVAMLLDQMQAACKVAFPDYPGGGNYSLGFNIKQSGAWHMTMFVWEGVRWTPGMLAWRAFWMAVPFGLTLVAALFFDRFDAQRAASGGGGRRPVRGRTARAMPGEAPGPMPALSGPVSRVAGSLPLGRLTERVGRSRLGALVLAELRIALNGVSRWWYFVVLAFVLLGLFVPLAGVRQFVAPFALIWPMLRWSPMGTREASHRTDALLFSSPRPVGRLLVAQWLAGWIIALMVSGGALVRFAVTGEWGSLVALLAGVVFVPSMALACGTWTGGAKLFEVLYLLLWYAGPMNRTPLIDFVGSTQPAAGPGAPIAFAVAALGLMAFAVMGRRRQLAR